MNRIIGQTPYLRQVNNLAQKLRLEGQKRVRDTPQKCQEMLKTALKIPPSASELY
jgi:hypothetical protein